jgi:hypothetical protein
VGVVGFPFCPSFVLSLDVCTIVSPHCLPVDLYVPVVIPFAHHTCPFYRYLGPSCRGSHSLLLSRRVSYILVSTCPQIGHRTILLFFTVCCFLSTLARAVPLASSHLDHHHHHPFRLHAPLGVTSMCPHSGAYGRAGLETSSFFDHWRKSKQPQRT